MKNFISSGAFALQIALTVSLASAQTAPANTFETKVLPVLAKNCFACHSGNVRAGGLDLSAFHDQAAAIQKPETWGWVRDKIQARLMPPPSFPALSAADTAAVLGWIETVPGVPKSTRSTSTTSAGPGRVTSRRLNRVEFNNTIRDFLGVTIHPADDFPVDNQGYGFDNIGDVLSLSPMLMEKFMAAARTVSRIAVFGETYEKKPGLVGKMIVKTIQDDGHVSGNVLPFSMRGDLEGIFHAPVEADYELQFRIANRRGRAPPAELNGGGRGGAGIGRGGRGGPRVPPTPEEIAARREMSKNAAPPVDFVVDVDGKQAGKDTVIGEEAYSYSRGPTIVKVHLTAGDHNIHAYFPQNANLDDPRKNLNPDGRRQLAGDFVEVFGPYNPSTKPPVSYEKIFICATKDDACARKIVTNLARRGFRRPPTEAETQRLIKLVALVRKQGDSFDEGIRVALQSILVSPAFLFRIEQDPPAGAATYQLNDYELASRLSYFVWSSMPDDELFGLAEQGKLHQPGMMQAQVKRMLRDPRAANLVDSFAAQWLDLRALDRKKPDPGKFPLVDDELLVAMRRETKLFVGEIFREDRSILDLIDGKFTYVNGPLARYYGIPNVDGVNFQRVSLEGTDRGGLLTQASILSLTSYATRTSPVIRGKWVLENLLGAPPPPPPPNVPPLEEKNLGADASVRVRLEQHRANPACSVCHNQMDPIGFGLENFDAAGKFRTKDGKFDVDSSGTLPDGRSFNGVAGLRDILKSQAPMFTKNFTEKMLTFALGRGLELSDRNTVEEINRKLTAGGNKLSALATAIVESEPFRMRKKEENLHASR